MKKLCSNLAVVIASCGIGSRVPFGNVIGSLMVFPVLGLQYAIVPLYSSILWWILGVSGVITIISLFFSLRAADDIIPIFVIDKIWGLLIVFSQVPFMMRLCFIGFWLFHLCRVLVPFIFKKVFHVDVYKFDGVVSIVLPSIVSGLFVNGFLRFMVWATQ